MRPKTVQELADSLLPYNYDAPIDAFFSPKEGEIIELDIISVSGPAHAPSLLLQPKPVTPAD